MGVFDEVKERVTAREVMERAGMWKLCRIGKRLSFSLIPCCGVRKMKRKQ